MKKALIVDDKPLLLSGAVEIVQKVYPDLAIESATDETTALVILEQNHGELVLVISDNNLGLGDEGLDITEQARKFGIQHVALHSSGLFLREMELAEKGILGLAKDFRKARGNLERWLLQLKEGSSRPIETPEELDNFIRCLPALLFCETDSATSPNTLETFNQAVRDLPQVLCAHLTWANISEGDIREMESCLLQRGVRGDQLSEGIFVFNGNRGHRMDFDDLAQRVKAILKGSL